MPTCFQKCFSFCLWLKYFNYNSGFTSKTAPWYFRERHKQLYLVTTWIQQGNCVQTSPRRYVLCQNQNEVLINDSVQLSEPSGKISSHTLFPTLLWLLVELPQCAERCDCYSAVKSIRTFLPNINGCVNLEKTLLLSHCLYCYTEYKNLDLHYKHFLSISPNMGSARKVNSYYSFAS